MLWLKENPPEKIVLGAQMADDRRFGSSVGTQFAARNPFTVFLVLWPPIHNVSVILFFERGPQIRISMIINFDYNLIYGVNLCW